MKIPFVTTQGTRRESGNRLWERLFGLDGREANVNQRRHPALRAV